MASVNEEKGNEMMEKGEQRLKKWSLFGSNTTKYEEAAEIFEKAGNFYKLAKNGTLAAKAFTKAADCHIQAGSKFEATTNFVNAANAIRKENVSEAVSYFQKASDLSTDEGKFSIAAKYQKEIGELYESELNYENSMEAYQKAAEFFEGENSPSGANTCYLKVAQFASQLEEYERAIEIYERVAKNSLDNNLLKWGVREYFLKAVLCRLCTGDIVAANRALEQYISMDATFSSQRECKFLQQIISACENYDSEAFTQAVVDFDAIQKLDQWKTTILLRIKNSIKEESTGLA